MPMNTAFHKSGWMGRLAGQFTQSFEESFSLSKTRLTSISIVGGVMLLAFYPVWMYFGEKYENLPLRLLGAGMCAPLALHRKWPKRLFERFYSFYFFFVGTYALVFFVTYMTFQNDFSDVWSYTLLSAVLILVITVRKLTSISMFAIGTLAAFMAFGSEAKNAEFILKYIRIFPVFMFVFIIGSFFSYRKDLLQREKSRALEVQAAYISHELKRPLFGIQMGLERLLDLFERRSAVEYRGFHGQLETEIANALKLFDLLLVNTSTIEVNKSRFERLCIADCVSNAVNEFPYKNAGERNYIVQDLGENFDIMGDPLLIK